jgi:hypothetical protein
MKPNYGSDECLFEVNEGGFASGMLLKGAPEFWHNWNPCQ